MALPRTAAGALPGHFYAVGVGPGAADLVTLRAARLIRTAHVVIAPRSARSRDSLALDTVRDLLRPRQEIVEHRYAMTRDEAATVKSWDGVAERVAERCRERRAVVQITIGDPLLYSTSAYLLPAVASRLGPDRVHVVPGISAMQAAAALFAEPLTLQEDRLTLMPATDLAAVARALRQCETLVLYKCAGVLEPLADLLEKRGLTASARLVCYAEQAGRQAVYTDLRAALRTSQGYMATLIVRTGRRKWRTS
jgi:precorrin-2/cobalt-factor-2 C20-methyltransferase